MKKLIWIATLFLAAGLTLAVTAPTAWPTVYNTDTVGPIADYLNEPILAARAAYNARLVAQGKPKITDEQGFDAVYLPKYPRDGWLRYSTVPPYQIIGPGCVGGFGLHEFQGHQEIWARVYEMGKLCLSGHPTTGTTVPTSVPATTPVEVKTPPPSSNPACIDTALGIPGPFGQCFTCAGVAIAGVENRAGHCVRVGSPIQPTPRPVTPVATAVPPAVTPCADVPGGRPGPFGWCYDCAGNQLGLQPCVAPVATPVPTVAATPPVVTTAPPAETPKPPSGKKGCGGCGGTLLGTLIAAGVVYAASKGRTK